MGRIFEFWSRKKTILSSILISHFPLLYDTRNFGPQKNYLKLQNFPKKANFKNPPHSCADIALLQHSAREEPNRTYITIQNLTSRAEGWGLTERCK